MMISAVPLVNANNTTSSTVSRLCFAPAAWRRSLPHPPTLASCFSLALSSSTTASCAGGRMMSSAPPSRLLPSAGGAAVILLLVSVQLVTAQPPGEASAKSDTSRAQLGIAFLSSYSSPGFEGAQQRINTIYDEGFRLVSLVPTFPYVGLNEIDFNKGVPTANLASTLSLVLQKNMSAVVKPHLEPIAFYSGYSKFWRETHSWRDDCPWRGYFDVDPMSPAYQAIIDSCFTAIQQALSRLPPGKPPPPPIRLEVGTELMNSIVSSSGGWVALLAWAKARRAELGLEKRVTLSHNFAHHIEIPEDEVLRMPEEGRAALAEYITGLDAIALSQYMDLSIAQEPSAREARATMPTALEVARSLARHDRNFRVDVLQGLLKIAPEKIPTIHIGEFGVGTGGLRHPNTWGGSPTGEEAKWLDGQVVRGYEGLMSYLSDASVSAEEGVPRSPTGILWITGPRFDVWGWEQQRHALPAAQAVAKAYLQQASAAQPQAQQAQQLPRQQQQDSKP